ncbi:MAG: uL4 family ribosomal protein [Nanoarchaeota archaeon]
MKSKVLDINGKEKGNIELPKCFSGEIREDIVAKVLEVEKTKQPYGPSPVAGRQNSASGKIVHKRHVWKSGYGRGRSRIPRKQMSRKGSQFNWVGAEVPNTRGGRRAHPPKVLSMINNKKINKKEVKIALISALSATTNKDNLIKRYERIEKNAKELPLIVDSGIISLKVKELVSSLKKILGKDLFEIKYKSNAGALLVIGEKENLKTNAIEIKNVGNLSVTDLAKGGLGRLTIYTEEAIKNLGEKLK